MLSSKCHTAIPITFMFINIFTYSRVHSENNRFFFKVCIINSYNEERGEIFKIYQIMPSNVETLQMEYVI